MLVFLRQFLLDVALEATEEIWAQHLVELGDSLLCLVIDGTELNSTL